MRAKKKYKSGGAVSRSARYYQENPEARKKKAQYDTRYHSTTSRKKYRSFLNKKNRDAGTYGNGDGKDWDHGVRRMISQSTNRAKKMQNGGKIPEPPKFFRNQMEKDLFISWYEGQIKDHRRSPFKPTATGGLKPSYPIFDLAGGLAVRQGLKQGVKQGFNLFKSAPSFMEKHGSKVFTALSAAETLNDFNEMNR